MFKISVNQLTLQHPISLSARDYEWPIAALQRRTSDEAPGWQPPFSPLFALLHTTLGIQRARTMRVKSVVSNASLYIGRVSIQRHKRTERLENSERRLLRYLVRERCIMPIHSVNRPEKELKIERKKKIIKSVLRKVSSHFEPTDQLQLAMV